MLVAELAGPARERILRAIHRAAARGENQLAAVLLLAQSDGYQVGGDTARALHLVQEGLTLSGIEPRTRERLLDSGVELTNAVSQLDLARRYAAESVTLTRQQASVPDDLDTQRDLFLRLNRLGDITRELDDPTTAITHYQQVNHPGFRHRRTIGRRLDPQRPRRRLPWPGTL
jgi:hypothetical protein